MDGWAKDVTLVTHGDLVGLVGVTGDNVLAGKEAVGDWFADWFRQLARDYRFEIDQVHDLGDRVLILVIHHTQGRTSGVPVTLRSGYLYTASDGKVSRMELWDNSEEALEAAGLSE
jgi:ketosteroid isomerase-like protein